MMDKDRINALGGELYTALRSQSTLAPLTQREAAITIEDAYHISLCMVNLRLERDGERIEGPVRGVSTSPLFFDVHLPADGRLQQSVPAAHNSFIYVYEGSLVAAQGTSLTQGLGAKQGGVFGPGGDALIFQAGPAGCRCLLLSAQPIGEPIAQYGPFVMNTREELAAVAAAHAAGELGSID